MKTSKFQAQKPFYWYSINPPTQFPSASCEVRVCGSRLFLPVDCICCCKGAVSSLCKACTFGSVGRHMCS